MIRESDCNSSEEFGIKNMTRTLRFSLPILDRNHTNEEIWKRPIQGWFANEGINDPRSQFEVIINSIKFQDIIEELVRIKSIRGRPPTLDECIPTIRGRLTYLNNKEDDRYPPTQNYSHPSRRVD